MPHATDPSTTTMPWTRLWRTGVLHSCASGIGGNYDDAFAQFWQQQFNRLPDSATIVDVGTGNGAIPLLAQSIADAEKRHWQIHGVDLADIDPPGSTAKAQHHYGNIRFHANTSMTELPFADGSADLVCSQFAFEYAPRERAASEILRVIGTHGHAALIAHSEDSVIHQVSRSQAAACTWLLQESRIFTAARQLLHHLAQAGDASARRRLANDPRAESARADFNASAVELMDRIEQTPEAQVLLTLAQELGPLLQHDWNSVEAADTALTALHDWVRDEQARLQLMLAASLNVQALQHVVALFTATGLAVRTGKLMYRGTTTMGWTMVVGHD